MQTFHPLSAVLRVVGVLTLVLAVTSPLPAQQTAPVLVTQAVDNAVRTSLPGNVHPLARAQSDRGEAPADLPLKRMLLVLKRSAGQETALHGLIDDQQDKNSPSYHQWLTPEEFGARFGPADSDIAAVTNWLKVSGFEVTSVSTGRTVIEFSGSAGLVKQAFGTAIHKYVDAREEHWANASNPSIPTALVPVVQGVLSLNNFPKKPHHTVLGPIMPDHREKVAPLPLVTINFQGTLFYGVGPGDFATIYDIPGSMDGAGQQVAIVGESNINIQDIRDFRRIFGLPPRDPNVILNGPDPGLQFDETEAVLDVSWSGAVAKNATIDFVVSGSTETTAGIDLSALYIVDNNVAPVMSESYGACELFLGNAGNAFYNVLWQQAAAQGITVLISSGDGGSAGCDDFNSASVAEFGLAMSGFASTPYNIAVGGTDFDQTPQNAPNYWNGTNNANTGASAKSYIRETPWNDSCAGVEFGMNGCVPNNFNFLDIVAGSGGPSNCAVQDNSGNCLNGYNKPAWQTGTGVRLDGVRDAPDVSLFASNGFNGSFYILCQADQLQGFPCSIGANNFAFLGLGGTSASAPAFAGIMALVNQKTGGRQGNANYVLYKLAAQAGASCDSSALTQAQLTNNSCIFYDTTKGNNSVPCSLDSPNCGTAPPSGYGVLVDPSDNITPAWTTTKGYDMATGLGSVNVANLVNKWSTATFTQSVTTLTNLGPVNTTHGQPVNVSVTVAPKTGSGTPTGSVALMYTPAGKTTAVAIDTFPLDNSGVASGTTSLLPGGNNYNVTAHYLGDGIFGASDSAAVQVTVGKEDSQAATTLVLNPYTVPSYVTTTNYGSVYLLRSDLFSKTSGPYCNPQAESACPSGTVSYLDNGSPMNLGSLTLNGFGYLETGTVQLTGGSHMIGAQYSGDGSFNSSTTNQSVTITPATTNLTPVSSATQVIVGQSFPISVTVNTQSYGLAPGGTVTFSIDGSPSQGSVLYSPQNGILGAVYASLGATLLATLNTPGIHMITASYGGDTNYATSQSPFPIQVDAQFAPSYANLVANPQAVTFGNSLMLTVTVGGNSKTFAPSGTVDFLNAVGGVSSPTYTTITDSNGNLALQAVATFTPTQTNQTLNARYSGDQNFTSAQTGSVTITITDATFTISPVPNVSISSPGQSGVANVTLNPSNGFAGQVSLTCSLPTTMTEATCPSTTIFVPVNVSTTAQLTISTMGPHQVAGTRPARVGFFGFGLVAGMFFLAVPRSRRKLPFAILLLMLTALIVSCGGGGGGHTDPGTPPGTYTATVTATAPGITQTSTFSVTVQ